MAPKSVTFQQHDHLMSVLFGDLLQWILVDACSYNWIPVDTCSYIPVDTGR